MTTHKLMSFFATLLLAVTFSGCGSSSNPPSTQPDSGLGPPPDTSACGNDCGTVLVGLTDADGDFLEYSITVQSLSLTRRDGVEVETLPQSAVVDFVQYTELTEFLTAASVPNGVYVAATITLDYAEAGVTVESNGEAVPANLVNADGEALGIETFELQLADDRPLVVAPGIPSIMVVDFDLAASHEVDLNTEPVTAVAAPFLVADIDPVDSKPLRLRGPLVAVTPDASSYVVAIRPFWHWNGDFGRVEVNTTNDTVFEIDGVSYAGAEGLLALSDKAAGTPTVAFGALDVAERSYTAREVYAGSSVPGHDADIVKGVISARVDDVLTVSGATIIREQGNIVFRGNVDVVVGPETTVHKAGDAEFDGVNGALSVGQKLFAFGRIVNETPDELLFDATDGKIRMLRTILTGTVNDISDTILNLDVQEMAGRNMRIFDFSGTGMPGQDADPDAYEINTNELNSSELNSGSPVKVSGFVTAFGVAPPDFDAATIADFSNVRSKLFMGWIPATSAPFLTVGPEGLVIDIENPDIGVRHHVVRGGILTNLLEQPSASILPRDDRPGLYGIKKGRSIRLHTDFSLFTRDLANQLGAGEAVRSTYASGLWSDTNGELQASRILIRLN